MIWSFRRDSPSKAEKLESGAYRSLAEAIASGDVLFATHEAFPFTRPGLPARRWERLDDEKIPRGSAVRALGNMAVILAGHLDVAGRQREVDQKTLEKIGAFGIAIELTEQHLYEVGDEKTALALSAADMMGAMEEKYFDWNLLPPSRLLRVDPEAKDSQVTANMAQSALKVVQEQLSNEAAR